MSMDTILASIRPCRKVHEFKSLFVDEDEETPRRMVVSPDIHTAVQLPFADTPEGIRCGEFRAWLESFVELGELSVSEYPFNKPPETMLARTDPIGDEVWSIRVTEPEDTPGIRAFGSFAEQNGFIALTWALREVIDDDFAGAVEDARDTWKDYFGEPPFKGESLDEYLTHYRAV